MSPPTSGSAGDPGEPVSVEALVATLEAVTAERDQHLADLQRVSADFANFRKQTDKRNADSRHKPELGWPRRCSRCSTPAMPRHSRASRASGRSPLQLHGILQHSGLEIISDEAEPFDPNRHEAAMTEPGDDGQDVAVVAEVLRTGYAWNGRVLRAAMVKVKG